MKTKISNTIQQWSPEIADLIPELDRMNDTVADYLLLHKLAEVCIQKLGSGLQNELEDVEKITKVINLLYQEGNQYTRNAIENEFLTTFSLEESPASLKKHLALFPAELRKEYIKTIVCN